MKYFLKLFLCALVYYNLSSLDAIVEARVDRNRWEWLKKEQKDCSKRERNHLKKIKRRPKATTANSAKLFLML